jgi:hypothetical protein
VPVCSPISCREHLSDPLPRGVASQGIYRTTVSRSVMPKKTPAFGAGAAIQEELDGKVRQLDGEG